MLEFRMDVYKALIDHRMNMLYLLAAICVIYKLAWISRQVTVVESISSLPIRLASGLVGTIILARALWRFMDDDAAAWIDIGRELSWCLFLFTAIVWVRQKTGSW